MLHSGFWLLASAFCLLDSGFWLGYISFLLFDKVVRYGQQHNQGLEAESDAARSWGGSAVLGRQRGLGGPPHERLPWFPP
ncbi:hypothetical protein BJP34_31855 [Moorena producens PAL-8-15-08-1]|uniref:Uncharacterized protein n=1 Tax=Moorena producens PAL-8-15-08-1 TaxID=1458985 RepID=A0A1D8U160_9CYAN|nr:hypothetical protein BJP34_31855 [Moorena producens PAL-8-15-08-1]